MAESQFSTDEVVRRGEALNEKQIRQCVEPENDGKFLVLDIETGDYEVDSDEVAALRRMRTRNPASSRYIVRIGFAAAHRRPGNSSVSEELESLIREREERNLVGLRSRECIDEVRG